MSLPEPPTVKVLLANEAEPARPPVPMSPSFHGEGSAVLVGGGCVVVVAQFCVAALPGGVVERGRAPGRSLVGAVVEVLPVRAGGNECKRGARAGRLSRRVGGVGVSRVAAGVGGVHAVEVGGRRIQA